MALPMEHFIPQRLFPPKSTTATGTKSCAQVPVDWAPEGVWQVDVKVHPPYNTPPTSSTAIQLAVNGMSVREFPVAVWLRQ